MHQRRWPDGGGSPAGGCQGFGSRESVRRRARAPACRPISASSAAAWTAVSSAPGFARPSVGGGGEGRVAAGRPAVGREGVAAVVRRAPGAGLGVAAVAAFASAFAGAAVGLAVAAFALAGAAFGLGGAAFVFAGAAFGLAGAAFALAGAAFAFAGAAFGLGGVALLLPAARPGAGAADAPSAPSADAPVGDDASSVPGDWARLSLRRCGRVLGNEAMTPDLRCGLIVSNHRVPGAMVPQAGPKGRPGDAPDQKIRSIADFSS